MHINVLFELTIETLDDIVLIRAFLERFTKVGGLFCKFQGRFLPSAMRDTGPDYLLKHSA